VPKRQVLFIVLNFLKLEKSTSYPENNGGITRQISMASGTVAVM